MNEKVIKTSLSIGGILMGYMLANKFFRLRFHETWLFKQRKQVNIHTLLFLNRIDIFLNCAFFIY